MRRYTPRNAFIAMLAVLALLTLCLVQPPVSANAPETAADPMPSPMSDHRDGPQFPPVGFVFGQTLRVTVAREVVVKLPGEPIVDRVYVEVWLFDAEGRVITQSDEIAIPPGEFRSFDFKRDSIPLAGEPGTGRLQVRGQICHRSFPITDRTNLMVWPVSVELLNETGHTTGSVALTAGRADAQNGRQNEIVIEKLSWGITPGQTARLSVVQLAFGDGSVRTVRARIQIVDTEGDVVAQSGEMRVEPGKTRFWDAPYEQIGAVREPGTGRTQLRARILFEERSFDRDRQPLVALELFDSSKGVTTSIIWQHQFTRERGAGPLE